MTPAVLGLRISGFGDESILISWGPGGHGQKGDKWRGGSGWRSQNWRRVFAGFGAAGDSERLRDPSSPGHAL